MLQEIKLYGTTSSGGALTALATARSKGFVQVVEWIDGTLDDGVDAVLSCVRDNDAADFTVLTLTDANSDAVYRPQVQVHSNTGAALTYDGTHPVVEEPFVNGLLKLVIASGGNAKTGGCIVYVSFDD